VKAIEKLIDHWAELDLDAPSRVHPADRAAMDRAEGFDTGFMPYPYVGDIRAADVWVLMLNSNIGPADAKQEAEPYFADRLRTNLKQDLGAYEHPMLSLDPKLRDTGTYEYYNKRNGLTKLVAELAKRSGATENASRRELARRLAVVQLFPYRSISGVPQNLLGEALASVRMARAAVAEALKSKLVVVPRSARNWGFEYGVREGNLFTFKADQARSASLQPGDACGGGDTILSRLTAS
jgi:hypothetical protein